jgi:hypothetical protein
LGVTIATDGLGSGLPASSAVANCTTAAPFQAVLQPWPIQSEGAIGATGTIDLTCTTSVVVVDGTLSCDERRGSATATRTWPLRCPALPQSAVFSDGFEAPSRHVDD